jgi:hypothetical protein
MPKRNTGGGPAGTSQAPQEPEVNYLRRALNHIDVGTWSVHRETWLNYLPNVYTSGEPPPVTAARWNEFIKVAQESMNAPPNKPAHRVVLGGFHAIVLRESIFLLHKAWHVLGAAERHAARGQPTWAQSSAYQAAFFAAKATFGLLGHPLVEYLNRMCLTRLFPVDTRSKTKGGPIHAPAAIDVIYLDKPFSHREIWELYQRALNTSRVDDSVWPSDTTTFLKLLPVKDFAAERNSLLYQADEWLFADLFDDVSVPGLGEADAVEKRWTFPNGGFSMRLGERCFHLGRALLKDLAELAPSLNGETELLTRTSTQGRHPFYFAAYA